VSRTLNMQPDKIEAPSKSAPVASARAVPGLGESIDLEV